MPLRLSHVPFFIFIIAYWACVPIAIFSPKAVAPLFTLVALAVLIDGVAARGERRHPNSAEWSLGAFIAACLASVAWSITPAESAKTLIAFVASSAATILLVRYAAQLSDDKRRVALHAVIGGMLIAYLILGFEYLTDGSLLKFAFAVSGKRFAPHAVPTIVKPALAVSVIFFWPWVYAVLKYYPLKWALSAIGLALLALMLFDSHTAILALILGISLGATAYFLKGYAVRLLGLGMLLFVFAVPFIARELPDPSAPGSHLSFLTNSAIHRVAIWRVAAERIFEEPVLGRGFDTARALYGPGTARTLVLLPDVPERTWSVVAEPIPLHPHNLILQIWLELGIVGAIVLCLLLSQIIRFIAQFDGLKQFVCFGLFGSSILISNIGFGAWQSWWLCAIGLSCAAMAAVLERSPSPTRS